MEISSSYNSYSTQSSSNSFDSYLNTQSEETTNNNQTSKLVDFIDKHNGFSSLSETDEKIFREILSDGILKNEEMKNLTYEQTKKLSNIINSAYSSIESLSNTPALVSEM
ncbi:hypothetical protein [Arcobacter aquimarinus]|uniref:hypothetical protein n=1 Tax=Arcobacter aquimarinus TaxID=1315211 RepID=UPI003BB1027E